MCCRSVIKQASWPAGIQEGRRAWQRKQDALMAIFVNSWGLCNISLSVRFFFLKITMNPPESLLQTQVIHRDLKGLWVTSVSIGVYRPLECCKCSPHAGQLLLLPWGLLTTPFFPKAAEQCMALSGFTRALLLWVAQGNITLALLEGKTGGHWGLNGQRWCWKVGWSQTNPTVSSVGYCCPPLIYAQISSFGHGEFMVWWSQWHLSGHTETAWISAGLNKAFWSSLKCQEDWYSPGSTEMRLQASGRLHWLKVRSLASVNAAWVRQSRWHACPQTDWSLSLWLSAYTWSYNQVFSV